MMLETCKDCIYCLKLNNHPSNEKYRGSILEHSGLYCCTVFSGENNSAVIFENDDGSCEEFIPRESIHSSQIMKILAEKCLEEDEIW